MAPGPALPAFSAAWGVPGAHLVMMTGRRELLRPEVKSVLQQFQIFADYEILNDTRLDTFSYKAQTLRRMCGALPCLEEVVIWEDRPEHSARFCELSASWPHLRWRVITVHPSQPHVVDAFNGEAAPAPLRCARSSASPFRDGTGSRLFPRTLRRAQRREHRPPGRVVQRRRRPAPLQRERGLRAPVPGRAS